MKQFSVAFLILCLLFPLLALADCPLYRDLSDEEASRLLDADTPVLEIVFPSIAGCDACILRLGDATMMIDGGSEYMASHGVRAALQAMGITHIDTAFCTHPHDDHVRGFAALCAQGYTCGRMVLCFDENSNYHIRLASRAVCSTGGNIEYISDGDVLSLGDALFTMIQRTGADFTVNDLSGILRLTYGDATFLFTGDIENRAQSALLADPPACGLKADLLKHPHHGYAPILPELLTAIQPQFVVVTGIQDHISQATALLNHLSIPWARPWNQTLRFRTDGHVWVLDTLSPR